MKGNVSQVRHSVLLIVVVLVVVWTNGCSVLTPSQVKEVQRFAQATESYDLLPSAVIEAHAELRKKEKIYTAAGFIPGEVALEQIEDALSARQEFQKRADQTKKILGVLDGYAQLLVDLTAEDFTNDLQKETQGLGKRIDKGIGEYNNTYGKEVKAFGGIIAAGVRGGGGFYIKRRQTLALREAVTQADPLMEEMSTAVKDLIDLYLTTGDQKGLIRQTEQSVKDHFLANVQGSMAKQPLYVASYTTETLDFAKNTYQLAKKAHDAISNLRQAHRDLRKNLQKKRSLKRAIETIKVFADEVKAATALKKKLEK